MMVPSTAVRGASALVVAAGLCFGKASAGGTLFSDSATVLELTPANFESVVMQGEDGWIVNFYADWCPHCIHFKPVWEQLSHDAAFQQLNFGALDCALHSEFCNHLAVNGYPSLRVYRFPGIPQSSEERGGKVPWDFDEDKLKKFLLDEVPKLPRAAPPTMGSSSVVLPTSGQAGTAAGAPQTSLSSSTRSPSSATAAQHEQGRGDVVPAVHLHDAIVSLLYTLRQGAVLVAASAEEGALPSIRGAALADLHMSLDVLLRLLPGEQLHEDLSLLSRLVRDAWEVSGDLPLHRWLDTLDATTLGGVPAAATRDPSPFYLRCAGYTCGLWMLFHIVTVSAALPETSVKPGAALHFIRQFVLRFFGCRPCSRHFVSTYDNCDLGRCSMTGPDPSGSVLWLWRVHDNVTSRVASENNQEQPQRFPSVADCRSCWPGEERAIAQAIVDEEAVYKYLRSIYWDPDWRQMAGQDAADLWSSASFASLLFYALIAVFVMLAAGVSLVLFLRSSSKRWWASRGGLLQREFDGAQAPLALYDEEH